MKSGSPDVIVEFKNSRIHEIMNSRKHEIKNSERSGLSMTVGELRKILEEQPIMADIVAECIEAEKNDPSGFKQAVPIIMKVIQDMKKTRGDKS